MHVLTHLWSIVSTVAYWRFLYRIFQEFSRPKYTVAAPTWQTKEHDKIANSMEVYEFFSQHQRGEHGEQSDCIAAKVKGTVPRDQAWFSRHFSYPA